MRKVKTTFNFKIDLNKLPVPDRLKLLIHKIVQEIEAKSAEGDYIFRGEPEHYEQVSSTLYRKCKEIAGEATDSINIDIVQANLLKQAMEHDLNNPYKMKKRPELYYVRMDSHFIEKNFEVLAEIQHWGSLIPTSMLKICSTCSVKVKKNSGQMNPICSLSLVVDTAILC